MPLFSNFPAPKHALRKQALSVRQSLSMDAISESICLHLEGWPLFQNSRRVLFYYPFRQEVDLRPLVPKTPQKNWYLPVVSESPEDGVGELSFFRYEVGSPLRVGQYGIAEPHAQAEPLGSLRPDDLILVPGLLFDRAGYRLGYGKGYYDRFLNRVKRQDGTLPPCAGITPDALWLEQLPTDTWDIPLPFIATEQGIFKSLARS